MIKIGILISIENGRNRLYQWDLNQRLILYEVNSGEEVHYAHRNDDNDNALVVKTYLENNKIYANIPNILLQVSGDIDVYVYVTVGNDQHTEKHFILRVEQREKPSDYVYTETETLTWKSLDERITELEKGGTGGSSVSIDDTLTISGAAADAKATGDQIRALSDEIANIPGGSGYGDMQKSVYDPNNKAKDIYKYADDAAKLAVTNHELSNTAHSDIRDLITGLTNRLNALADSDDTTLDQLSEIVAYIKSNKSLIDAITTEKVSVSDIIDNLTTNNANKPLSAAQGVALKALIDGITIPEKLPNPNALTFSGSVNGTYDGSEPFTVNIPSSEGGSGGIGGLSQLATVTLTDPAVSIVLNFTAVEDIIISAQFTGGLDESTSTTIKFLQNYDVSSGAGYNHNAKANLSSSAVGYYIGYLYSQSLKMRGVLYAQTNINIAGNTTALRYWNIEDKIISSIRVFTDSATPFGIGTTITVYGGKL